MLSVFLHDSYNSDGWCFQNITRTLCMHCYVQTQNKRIPVDWNGFEWAASNFVPIQRALRKLRAENPQ